jgi:anti-sigma B factor antagonist
MPNDFSVHRQAEADLTVLTVEGFLDAHTAPRFEEEVQAALEEGSVRLIVDAGRLGYISSAGLGVFMGFIEEIREKGGDLKICGLVPQVKEVFDLLGFDALFDIVEDRAAAAARFAANEAS